MTSTSERFQAVAEGCRQRIAAVPEDRWDAPTPCPPWSVRDLVTHLIDTEDLLLAAVDRQVEPDADAAPADRFHRRADALVAAMDDPAAASTPTPSPLGEFAFKQVVGGVILHDMLVHTWDLARAAGLDDTLDAEAVASAYSKMQPFDELLRGPGMFGPRIDIPEDAPEQDRFVAFLGRDPKWAA